MKFKFNAQQCEEHERKELKCLSGVKYRVTHRVVP